MSTSDASGASRGGGDGPSKADAGAARLGRRGVSLDAGEPVPGSHAVPRPKAALLVADAITDEILEGGLEPGMSLPGEAQMMRQYDVGRNTLREALRLLEAEGIIRVRPGRFGGPTVQELPPGRLGRTLSLVLRFSGASFAAVIEARRVIEPSLARSAAQRATDEERSMLAQSVREQAELLGDELNFMRSNRQFHALIATAAHSDALAAFLRATSVVSDGQQVGVHYDARARAGMLRKHEQIVGAIVDGNADLAEAMMERHMGELCQHLDVHYPHLLAEQVRVLKSDSR